MGQITIKLTNTGLNNKLNTKNSAYGGKRRSQTNEHFQSLTMALPSFNLLSMQIRFSLDGLILFKKVWFNFSPQSKATHDLCCHGTLQWMQVY